VSMRLFAYQFQHLRSPHAPSLKDVLDRYHVTAERFYEDTLGDRPELATLLADCRQDAPGYIVLESPPHLAHSQAMLLEHLQQLWDCGIGVIALNLSTDDSGDYRPLLLVPDSWPHSPIALGTFPTVERANAESWIEIGTQFQKVQRRQRVKQGHDRNRLQELPPPGQAPYGYRRGKTSYLVDRRAAPVVKGFYENFLLYGCLRRAVRHVASAYGKSISPSTGKRWLTHPVYRGHLRYRQSEIISNTHPALLLPLEAAQVDRLLKRNQRFANRAASAPRSLSGLVQCATCGSGMTVSQVSRSKRQYLYLRPQQCPNHRKCSGLGYDQVLDRTITTICDRLPQAIASLPTIHSDPKEKVLAQIDQQRQILAQIPTLLELGVLDHETAQMRTYRLKTELSKLEAQLNSFSPVNLKETAQTIAIPEFWRDLSETERRFYLREFIRSIQITRTGKDWTLSLNFVFEAVPASV
ncbi:MAG: recombinase zinc beta ribbon domain-containing protein, partial [Cyanobacteria bacterium P01_F01_bin.42]